MLGKAGKTAGKGILKLFGWGRGRSESDNQSGSTERAVNVVPQQAVDSREPIDTMRDETRMPQPDAFQPPEHSMFNAPRPQKNGRSLPPAPIPAVRKEPAPPKKVKKKSFWSFFSRGGQKTTEDGKVVHQANLEDSTQARYVNGRWVFGDDDGSEDASTDNPATAPPPTSVGPPGGGGGGGGDAGGNPFAANPFSAMRQFATEGNDHHGGGQPQAVDDPRGLHAHEYGQFQPQPRSYGADQGVQRASAHGVRENPVHGDAGSGASQLGHSEYENRPDSVHSNNTISSSDRPQAVDPLQAMMMPPSRFGAPAAAPASGSALMDMLTAPPSRLGRPQGASRTGVAGNKPSIGAGFGAVAEVKAVSLLKIAANNCIGCPCSQYCPSQKVTVEIVICRCRARDRGDNQESAHRKKH